MRILITGGCGFLGSSCAELLSTSNFEVSILSSDAPEYMKEWIKKYKLISGDITDINISNKICEDYFDAIIHFAAANERKCALNPREAIDINVFGTKNMLDICKKKNINKFIYISTFHVYGSQKNYASITEETEPNPVNEYAITHYFGELYCKQFAANSNISCIILRPSNFYSGPLFNEINRWELIPNNFIKQVVESGKILIKSSGCEVRNFISINDLYSAIMLSLEYDKSKLETFNVGGEKNYSVNDIAQIVADVYKNNINNKDIPIEHLNKNAGKETKFTFDISKIKAIGYKPHSNIDEEIKETFIKLIGM